MSAILFIGGMKSGKSAVAEREALSYPLPRLYIATSEVIDDEMKKRVELHKKRREGLFDTLEEPLKLDSVINEKQCFYNVILIDCLTFWYNNLFYYLKTELERENYLKRLLGTIKNCSTPIIMVTNELGMGIIPENKLARAFIDFSGKANQSISELCNKSYFVVSGKKFLLE